MAVDTGIAQAAIDETVQFVQTRSRAWIDSGVANAWDDRYTIQAIVDLTLRLHAAQSLLEKAGPMAGPVHSQPGRRQAI